ncbi:MAG TPA: nucleotidyltransferase [Chloroflexi bacterium]|nr:nucleotidyltransferase [Chloroflexota bacterium]
MKTLQEIRTILEQHQDELRTRFFVREIGIFGSRVRGTAGAASDVDVLVELERPLGWEIVDLRDYLEAILGMKVDLVTANAVRRKPWLWASIQEDLVYV